MGRGKKASRPVRSFFATIQARDDGGLDQVDRGESAEVIGF